MALSLLADMVIVLGILGFGTRVRYLPLEEAIDLNKKCTARCEMVGCSSGLRGQSEHVEEEWME